MPRILRIINRLNLGGPTYNVAYLSKYLAPEYETMLVAGIKEDSEESSEFIVDRMGLKPVYIPQMRRDINFSADRLAYRRIKEIIGEFKPDIVHTHAAKAGTLGRLAAISMKVPVIVHTFHGHVFHSYFNPVKTYIFKHIERYLAERSSGIIAISELQKHELCNIHHICNSEKTTVIPLGFGLNRFRENQQALRLQFRQTYGLTDDVKAVAIIGRIVPVKNHRLFINAFRNSINSYPGKLRGFIIGDGENTSEIITLAISAGLRVSTPVKPLPGADLVFTSWIKDIEYALAGCDIVAMTSLNEGTPVSLIEAQAAGKPIVSTNVGGISNVVIPGETALLSEAHDEAAFSENLLKLLNDNDLCIRMSEKGWPFVKEKFHYQRLVNDMRQYYAGLLTAAGNKSLSTNKFT